ncbi:hypothetical protein [Sphingobacterium sp.]|uniref:hypothetical protein n=1 Tax=Sphingobacterium sp. TaxID=341027 RepID=UPI0031DA76E4
MMKSGGDILNVGSVLIGDKLKRAKKGHWICLEIIKKNCGGGYFSCESAGHAKSHAV